jgi:hypothetical protein
MWDRSMEEGQEGGRRREKILLPSLWMCWVLER